MIFLWDAGQSEGPYAIILLMNKPLALLSAIAFLVIVVLMFFLSPTEAGPLGIFAFFVLCYMFFLGLAVNICKLFFVLANKVKKNGIANIDKKSYRYGLVVAIAPELMIILSSGGAFGWVQIIAILIVEILLCFIVGHSRV